MIADILGPSRFLPSPVKVEQTPNGIKLLERDGEKDSRMWLNLPWRIAMDSLICRQSEIDPVPFDLYCSTSSNVMKRYCKLCGIYFVNMAAYQRHKKAKICLSASDDAEEQQDIPDCENEELITSNSDQPRNLFERFEELFEDGTTD